MYAIDPIMLQNPYDVILCDVRERLSKLEQSAHAKKDRTTNLEKCLAEKNAKLKEVEEAYRSVVMSHNANNAYIYRLREDLKQSIENNRRDREANKRLEDRNATQGNTIRNLMEEIEKLK
jgi:hypothetical protein